MTTDISTWGLIKSYIIKHPIIALLLLIISIVYPIESVLVPYLLSKLTRSVIDRNVDKIRLYLKMIAVISIIILIIYNLDLYISNSFSESMTIHIQNQVVQYIFETFNVGVNTLNSGEIMCKIQIFAKSMTKRIDIFRNNIFPDLLALLFQSVYLMFLVDIALGLLILLVMFILAISVWNAMNATVCEATISNCADQKLLSKIEDVFDNFSLILDNNSYKKESNELTTLGCNALECRQNSVLKTMSITTVINVIIIFICFMYVLRLYMKLIPDNSVQVEVTVNAITILMETLYISRNLMYNIYYITFSSEGLRDIVCYFDNLKCDSLITKNINLESFNNDKEEIIELKDVNTKYGENEVFKTPLNKTILKNSKTAIIGQNGCGKTTLFKLLTRKQNVSNGEIIINNTNINNIDVKDLRKNIAYGSQTPYLFDKDIMYNISYSNPRLLNSENSVWRYLRYLGLENFFKKSFPKGLKTLVGKNGNNLSGGQKQIIQLVRLLSNNDSKIILLDEITSAVDDYHKSIIIDLLKKIKNKTILVIAHDTDFINKVTDNVIHI